jgi:hypothetical protein
MRSRRYEFLRTGFKTSLAPTTSLNRLFAASKYIASGAAEKSGSAHQEIADTRPT